ncbi:MAG TPA: hypothetical protein VNR36_00450 [Pseudolysinimonas sp.]|nr:hypothetical protein [Pseudolysinimonas sp.]
MSPRPVPPAARVVIVPVVLSVIVAVILLAFLWPVLTGAPRDLPVAVTGPAPVVGQLSEGIDAQAPGVFDLTTVEDRDAAVAAIEAREAYGALVLGAAPEVLVSSAASPVAAQALAGLAPTLQARLQQAAAAQAAAQGAEPPVVTVEVTDVVPLAETDERGAGLGSAVLPLTIGGLLAGVLITLGVAGRTRRIAALVVAAVLGGLVLGGILQGWLGVLQGSYLANATAIGLVLLACGAFVAGAASLLGRPGIAVGVVTLVLIAVPLASAATPVEFLPAPWGAVGQWFPPGAGATLLRDLSYFPAADALQPWLVLTGWAVVGLLVLGAGRRTVGATGSD